MKDVLGRGFTIIEIIVIIVVIGILATFTSIGYSGVAQQSRDTKRRTDTQVLAGALKSWANDTNKNPTQTSGGYNGTGQGYVRGTGSNYTTNIDSVLSAAGYLAKDVADPKTPSGIGSYMFYACTADAENTTYGFFAKLEAPKAKDTTTINNWQASSCTTEPLSAYNGMNYVEIFTLQ